MRALLINPTDRTVTEIEHDGSLHEMYRTIGCGTVQALELGRGETLWLDDNGMLAEGNPVWRLKDFPHLLAGKGLILGNTQGGNSTDTKVSLPLIARLVEWTDQESTGHLGDSETIEGEEAMRRFGASFAVIGGQPITRTRQQEGGAE